jgi:hypothetical protein
MKIGFLAMSGIRAHDPKLLEMGLTLPGVVERSKVVASLPSLGLLYLAAVTPPEHDLHYFDVESEGSRRKFILATWLPSAHFPLRFSKHTPSRIGYDGREFAWPWAGCM